MLQVSICPSTHIHTHWQWILQGTTCSLEAVTIRTCTLALLVQHLEQNGAQYLALPPEPWPTLTPTRWGQKSLTDRLCSPVTVRCRASLSMKTLTTTKSAQCEEVGASMSQWEEASAAVVSVPFHLLLSFFCFHLISFVTLYSRSAFQMLQILLCQSWSQHWTATLDCTFILKHMCAIPMYCS